MDKTLKLANIELKLPPDELMVSPLRLLVSGLASRFPGFTVDEIEDLKASIGEAFLAVADRCKTLKGAITVRWSETQENLSIRITDPSHTFTKVENVPLFQVLERVADEISVGEGEEPAIRLRFNLKERRKPLFKD